VVPHRQTKPINPTRFRQLEHLLGLSTAGKEETDSNDRIASVAGELHGDGEFAAGEVSGENNEFSWGELGGSSFIRILP
jgi:hypothetical protein